MNRRTVISRDFIASLCQLLPVPYETNRISHRILKIFITFYHDFSACQAQAVILGGDTLNWNSVGQCSIENCVDPPENNLNLWYMPGANVYTLESCVATTPQTPGQQASTQQTLTHGDVVFTSRFSKSI